MEEKIIIHCYVEKKKNVLSKPDLYTDSPMICLMVKKEYYKGLLAYSRDHDMGDLEVTLSPWPEDVTDRARKFFFAVRDALAKASGDSTKKYKDHLYRSCLADMCLAEGQEIKNSLTDLNKRELWLATNLMWENAVNCGADLRHLQVDYKVNQGEKE